VFRQQVEIVENNFKGIIDAVGESYRQFTQRR
jgi:hypothetical protein